MSCVCELKGSAITESPKYRLLIMVAEPMSPCRRRGSVPESLFSSCWMDVEVALPLTTAASLRKCEGKNLCKFQGLSMQWQKGERWKRKTEALRRWACARFGLTSGQVSLAQPAIMEPLFQDTARPESWQRGSMIAGGA